jgi:hypothetical protein
MSVLPPATAGAAPPPAHKTYSSLVQAEDDLIGHVAYALYKRDKLAFVDSIKGNLNRPPDEAELAIFIVGCNLPARLQAYRAQAELLLERMTEFQLEGAIQEVQRLEREEYVAKLEKGKSWMRVIAEALVGSVVVAVVWAALVLVLYTNKIGADKVARDILSIDVTAKPASGASR